MSLPERAPAKPNPYSERGAAFELYHAGNYAAAQALLAGLLERGFEPASTHCHVARICLITGRSGDAREHIARAWAARDGAPAYVVARILWLQLAVAFLDSAGAVPPHGEIPNDAETLIGKLKTVLHQENAVQQWTMEPVLLHVASRLSDEQNALLAALVTTLSGEGEAQDLDAFELWRSAVPV